MDYKVEYTLFIFVIFICMKSGNLRAFTFVELIITLSILALLSVIWYTAVGNKQENTLNTKVTSEVETLKNALLLAKQETSQLPMPDGNNNFYSIDTSYSHDYENENTYGVHGFITQNTLAKKYIDVIPVDPRTNSYFAYGKTKWSEMYEIASVVFENDEPKSKVIWDYTAIEWPFNLIRQYNGPYFVEDNSLQNFAYNPYEKILTAKIWDNSGNVTVNGENLTADEISNIHLVSGDTIEIPQNNNATIYFSDGTVSALWDTSQATKLTLQNLEFPKENNLITKVQLVLQSGMIWNKAASLDEESEFEIYTIDSTAAVRGTVFWVQKNSWNSKILVSEWKVAVYKNYEENIETLLEKISTNKPIYKEQVDSRNNSVITIDEETQESVIEVESDESTKWVQIDTQSQWEIEPTNDSLEDIPEEIKKDIIDNRILFSKNIWFWVDTLEVDEQWKVKTLILKMHKKVWDWLDNISITSSQWALSANIWKDNILIPQEKNNQYLIDLSDDISAWYVSYHLPTKNISQKNVISIFSTANADYTKQVWNQRWSSIDLSTDAEIETWKEYGDVIPTSELDDDLTAAWTAWESKNLGTITIQLIQKRNWKTFESKSLTVPLIKEAKISQEKPKDELPLLVRENPILPPLDEDGNNDEDESECSKPFWADNQYCWKKTEGIDIEDDYELKYYAPYELAGDIKMYKQDSSYTSLWNGSILDNKLDLPSYCNDWSDEWSSFCIQEDWSKGIFIDSTDNDDYIKYSRLDVDDDFIIEMNVYWDWNNDNKSYLIDSWDNFKLFIDKDQLYIYNNRPFSHDNLKLALNEFNNIQVKNEWDKTYLKVWINTTDWIEFDKTQPENYMYIWGLNARGSIAFQINNVIDYIKIYKK